MDTQQPSDPRPIQQVIEIAIRLGLTLLLLVICLNILSPFISLVLWAGVIAVAISKPFAVMQEKLGDSKKLAVTVFIAIGLSITLIPAIMFSGSLFQTVTHIGLGIADGTFVVQPPNESVRDWPVVGAQAFEVWSNASSDLTGVIQGNRDMLADYGRRLAGIVVGLGSGIIQFAISIIIAGVFLANSDASNSALRKLSRRLRGTRGDELVDLTVATIRSIAVGVLGIAAVQALLAGVGMVAVGVPGAGLWTLIVLVFAVAQIPALLVLIPVAFYVFSVESTTVSVIYLLWSVVVALSDTVLKPMLLGRGVEAPMLVILLGAIGGMIYLGIIGLFLGAVILALAYKLMISWLVLDDKESES
mgnify:FL=1|jgi:predicted PurR-regulated permease PerM